MTNPIPQRRHTDKRIIRFWRDLVPLLAVGLAFWAVVLNGDKADRAEVQAFSARARIIDAEARNVRRIERVEKKDRDTARASAFRICSRAMVDRAFAQARVGLVGGPPAIKRLQQKGGLPILDCTPNLIGNPARPLSPARQRSFVRRWMRGELTNAELGICKTPIGTKLTYRKSC